MAAAIFLLVVQNRLFDSTTVVAVVVSTTVHDGIDRETSYIAHSTMLSLDR